MGLERKTLLYCVISGFSMLACIWILPKFFGLYSLFVGLFFLHGLTTLLNLILIAKSCKFKPVYLKFTLYSVAFCLPTILLGFMLKKLLLACIGSVFTLFALTIILIIFNALLYFGFNLISIDFIKSKLTPKKNSEKNLKSA
jgi:hypothetical protein